MFYVTHVWIIYLSDFSIHHNYLRSKHWGFTHPATKSLFRAFSCVQHMVRHVGYHILQKRYLLHNKVIKVVSTFASISYHWSLSAVIRRTHSNFPIDAIVGPKKEQLDNSGAECRRKYLFLSQRKILGGKHASYRRSNFLPSDFAFCLQIVKMSSNYALLKPRVHHYCQSFILI